MDIVRTIFKFFAKDNSDFGYFHDIKKFDLIDRFSLNFDCLDIHDFFIWKTHNTEKIFTKRSRRKIEKILYRDGQSIFFKTADRNIYYLKDNKIYRIKLSDIPVKPLSVVGCRSNKIVLSNLKNDFAVINMNTFQVSLLRFDWKVISCAFLDNESLLFTTRETVDGPGEIICVDREISYLWTFIFKEKLSYIFGPVGAFPHKIISDNKVHFVSSCLSILYFFSGRRSRTEIDRSQIFHKNYYLKLVKNLYYTIDDNFMAVWDDSFFALFDKNGSLISHNEKEWRKQKKKDLANSFLCDNYVINFCFKGDIYKPTAYIYNLQGKLLHQIDIDFEPFSVSIFYKADTLIVMSGHIINEGKAVRRCCYLNLTTGTLSDFDFKEINCMKNCIVSICINNYLWLSEQMDTWQLIDR